MDKMGQLAAALDGEARQVILSDIAQMQQMAARVTSESSDDRSVELMTVAFSRMSNEVTALLEARTREMKMAYEQVAQINSEMRSSINYASVLQRAMLRAECFPDDFKIHLTWQPRDVVGGDIYVVRTTENKTVISVIDCTGHGVPGAFTSLIARAAFDCAFEDPAIVSAGDYLSESNRLIKNMLFQNEAEQAESDAGFDGTVCILDRVSGTLEFAGANASLFVIESGQVTELKGDKKSVGARRTPGGYKFTTQLVNAPKGMFVMLTDGVTDVMRQDQRPIAFGRKRLMRLMESIDASDSKVVVGEIMQAVDQYKGSGELRDDLTLLAFYIDQLQQFERAALPHDSVPSGSLEG
jgi:serine phosphatase RsbU (regulator of sigma subunit)